VVAATSHCLFRCLSHREERTCVEKLVIVCGRAKILLLSYPTINVITEQPGTTYHVNAEVRAIFEILFLSSSGVKHMAMMAILQADSP
jgi:hypothetical protein